MLLLYVLFGIVCVMLICLTLSTLLHYKKDSEAMHAMFCCKNCRRFIQYNAGSGRCEINDRYVNENYGELHHVDYYCKHWEVENR